MDMLLCLEERAKLAEGTKRGGSFERGLGEFWLRCLALRSAWAGWRLLSSGSGGRRRPLGGRMRNDRRRLLGILRLSGGGLTSSGYRDGFAARTLRLS